MPSINAQKYVDVDVDFAWSEVVCESLSEASIEALAEALFAANLVQRVNAKLPSTSQSMIEDGGLSEVEFDHLVSDYARGISIDSQIRALAQKRLGRVLV